jgi:DNA-binding NarL/FixJ family response regulator
MEHKVIVAGVKNLMVDALIHHLNNRDGLIFASHVESTAQLKPAAKKHKPDCIFMCPSMLEDLSDDDCIDYLHGLNGFNLLVGAMSPEPDFIHKLLAGQVQGILLIRETCIDELVTAIDTVAMGKHYFSEQITQVVYDHLLQKPQTPQPSDALTERETEVLRLVADGFSSKEIAKQLLLSPATVNVHRRNIMMKTGVRKSTALVKLVNKLP